MTRSERGGHEALATITPEAASRSGTVRELLGDARRQRAEFVQAVHEIRPELFVPNVRDVHVDCLDAGTSSFRTWAIIPMATRRNSGSSRTG
jgi:hypothetical protein